MTIPTHDLPNRIRAYRKRAGMTQQDLGDEVGLSKAGVSFLEKGERPLTLPAMQSIARALSKKLNTPVSPGDLLNPEDNPAAAFDDSERSLLSEFRNLDARGRRSVTGLVRSMQEDPAEQKRA